MFPKKINVIKGSNDFLKNLKPRLHKRFFACDGDAFFFKLSRLQCTAKLARVATLWQSPWFCRKKSNSLNLSRFFSVIFSAVASLVWGWLHMRFSPRAGDATIFKRVALPSQAENRLCSRGLSGHFHYFWSCKIVAHLKCKLFVKVNIKNSSWTKKLLLNRWQLVYNQPAV